MTRLLYMVAGLCAAVVFTACAKPTYTFVTNSDDHVYFKVPASWSEIKQRDLDQFTSPGLDDAAAAALRAQTWTVAFDAGDKPSIAHVFSTQVKAPVVFARVLRSSSGDSTNITLDALRDFFLPVTKAARMTARASGSEIPGFKSVVDHVMSREDGLTGVHEVFRYKVSGVMQTFDETALVTKDASRVYVLLVRCTQACYADRQGELATVVRSFIVKSGP